MYFNKATVELTKAGNLKKINGVNVRGIKSLTVSELVDCVINKDNKCIFNNKNQLYKIIATDIILKRENIQDFNLIYSKNKSIDSKLLYIDVINTTMDNHKYLDDLGIPKNNQGVNFVDGSDSRYADFMKERKIYSFDSRETWNLCDIFVEWLYEHLLMYKERAGEIIDLEYYKYKVDNEELTQLQIIDRILAILKVELLKEAEDYGSTDWNKVNKALSLFSIIVAQMSW